MSRIRLLLRLYGTPPLLDSLVEHWSGEEVSGDRVGDDRGLVLSSVNGVGQGTGIVGNCPAFVAASSQYLTTPDSSLVSMGNHSFMVGAWVNPTNTTGVKTILSQWGVAPDLGYTLDLNGNAFRFYISTTGTGNTSVASATLATAGAWHFVLGWYDVAEEKLCIQVNDGAVAMTTLAGGCHDSPNPLLVGARQTSVIANYMDGRIDEWFIEKRAPTAEQRSYLYNSGAGRSWAEWRAYREDFASGAFRYSSTIEA